MLKIVPSEASRSMVGVSINSDPAKPQSFHPMSSSRMSRKFGGLAEDPSVGIKSARLAKKRALLMGGEVWLLDGRVGLEGEFPVPVSV